MHKPSISDFNCLPPMLGFKKYNQICLIFCLKIIIIRLEHLFKSLQYALFSFSSSNFTKFDLTQRRHKNCIDLNIFKSTHPKLELVGSSSGVC